MKHGLAKCTCGKVILYFDFFAQFSNTPTASLDFLGASSLFYFTFLLLSKSEVLKWKRYWFISAIGGKYKSCCSNFLPIEHFFFLEFSANNEIWLLAICLSTRQPKSHVKDDLVGQFMNNWNYGSTNFILFSFYEIKQ